jgi:type 1 fimbria pilin
MHRGAVAFLVSLAALGAVAESAVASQPVTVDFSANGTATVNAQMSPGGCNGPAIYATLTDVIPFHWETKFNTTINNDDTIVDEPGYLVSHDFGNQTANVVGSGGDGSPACNQAIVMSIQSCPQDVEADAVGGGSPHLSDPDRAAQQPGPHEL